jgi:hypothetical protein
MDPGSDPESKSWNQDLGKRARIRILVLFFCFLEICCLYSLNKKVRVEAGVKAIVQKDQCNRKFDCTYFCSNSRRNKWSGISILSLKKSKAMAFLFLIFSAIFFFLQRWFKGSWEDLGLAFTAQFGILSVIIQSVSDPATSLGSVCGLVPSCLAGGSKLCVRIRNHWIGLLNGSANVDPER